MPWVYWEYSLVHLCRPLAGHWPCLGGTCLRHHIIGIPFAIPYLKLAGIALPPSAKPLWPKRCSRLLAAKMPRLRLRTNEAANQKKSKRRLGEPCIELVPSNALALPFKKAKAKAKRIKSKEFIVYLWKNRLPDIKLPPVNQIGKCKTCQFDVTTGF